MAGEGSSNSWDFERAHGGDAADRIHPCSEAVICTEAVILVHGMLAGGRSMRRIANRLSGIGYLVRNWSYPTLTRSMRVHADKLSSSILQVVCDPDVERIHFVGHSMGCIVLRLALQRITVPCGSRFVMLAPPNAGSRLTRLSVGPFASFFPQLGELSEAPDSLVNLLPEPSGVDVGIIAADRDRIVELGSTHLRSQRDHCIVPSTHQRLPSSEAAIDQVQSFLRHASFDRGGMRASEARRAA